MGVFLEEYGGVVVLLIFGVGIIAGLFYGLNMLLSGGMTVESVVMKWLVS